MQAMATTKDLTPDKLQAWLQAELGNWQENVRGLLIDNLRRQRLELSGGLIDSMDAQVIAASGDILGKVHFVFSDHGRHKDMRNLVYTQQPPVEALEEFVRKVGVDKFRYVPGYTSGKVPSESIAIKRIAWGISKGRLKGYKHKPKKWFAKSFYGQINVLIGTLIQGYQESLVNQAKAGIAGN